MEEESDARTREQERARMRLPKLKGAKKLLTGNPINDVYRGISWLFGKAKGAPKSKLGQKIRRELHR